MRIILVRGIGRDPDSDLKVLGSQLAERGIEVIPFEYHTVRVWNARWKIDDVARSIRNFAFTGDHVVAHSFGCAATYRAMYDGARFGRVVFFGAAMAKEITFPYHGFQRLMNVTNPHDKALTWGSWLPLRHPFGLLGRDSYAGPPDERIVHVQTGVRAGRYSHSAPYLSADHLPQWTEKVHAFLAE